MRIAHDSLDIMIAGLDARRRDARLRDRGRGR
jgi:hypothetical protein